MNSIDLSAIQKALSLVRAGRLRDATSCIQANLMQRQEHLPTSPLVAKPPVRHSDVQDLIFKPIIPTISSTLLIGPAGKMTSPESNGSIGSTRSTKSTSSTNSFSVEHEPSRVIESALSTKIGSLAYRLFVPERRATVGRAPLVVMLHGCQQNSRDFAAGTQMDRVAGKEGCFVLYPQQSSRANSAACWNWFKHTHQVRERGEPHALADLISHLIGAYEIDASRVYVAGLSAGAAMAAILGEQYPDLFAAVGVHSGLPTGMAKNLPDALQAMQGRGTLPTQKPPTLPTIVFHGDADSTVSPVNGFHFAETMSRGPETTVETLNGTMGRPFTRKIYRNGEGVLIGEHWSIRGAGHAWSGGSSSGSYTDPSGPDASVEMMRFFLESKNSKR